MKKKKVISRSNLPQRLPLFETLALIAFVKVLNTPEWLIGILAFVLFIMWMACIISIIWGEHQEDIFKNDDA